ncbi:hypothetical protein AQUCO_00100834v1 [Aquilegia coerulea]|uniref:F-box domain-containing protein n=1 Tax=Aquilegia coerulea TaxID=218851 RepID=A0A2G5FC64_AQUCA|nr:hypothetical protein AQUCO_00100834v1 [Aquilegia coerulea]
MMKPSPSKTPLKESKRDRFIDLPVEIIHRILSFMLVTEIAKTSLLSTRWRNSWRFAKYLNFDNCRDKKKNLKRKRSICPDLADQVLALRSSSDIYKLSYSCHEKFSMDRLNRWITIGLTRNIQELHLETYFPPIKVPSNIFQSPIKVFKLHQLGRYAVRLPKSVCSATMITTLELHSVRLPHKDTKGGLVIKCPVLENLIIRNCDEYRFKTLTISAFQLKSFELFNINVTTVYLKSLCKLYVNTPNLTSIKFKGSILWECRTRNLPSLVTAEVDLKKAENIEEKIYARNLSYVLRMTNEVQTLTLSTSHVKSVSGLTKEEGEEEEDSRESMSPRAVVID